MTEHPWLPGLLTLAVLTLYGVVLLWGVRRGVRTIRAEIQEQTMMVVANANANVALLDLPGEARTGILKVLESARAQGLTEDAMIELLRDKVPAGRWSSVDTRAQIIVRSESRFASNMTTSEYARQIGARLLVFDARLGPTDSVCEERAGWVVSPSEAAALSGTEHPSGTLAFAPINQGVTLTSGTATP